MSGVLFDGFHFIHGARELKIIWPGLFRPECRVHFLSLAGSRNSVSGVTAHQLCRKEGLAFANLCLVLKIYVRHGFDRSCDRFTRSNLVQVPVGSPRNRYILFTLWMEMTALKARVWMSRVRAVSRLAGSPELNRTFAAAD